MTPTSLSTARAGIWASSCCTRTCVVSTTGAASFIHSFIHSLTQDLSLVEEYHTLTKFHKFLREYAALLNFQLDYWKSIIFIIYQNDTPITVSNRQRKKALKEGNLDIHSHLYKVETMEDLLQGSVGSDTSTSKDIMRVDVHGKEHRIKFIVSIPHDYIDRFLLEFLRQHLPLTNHFYTVKKDENI